MAYVYWIHLKEHTDITKEGYIGVSVRPVMNRFSAHKNSVKRGSKHHVHCAIRKYGESIIVDTLLEGSEECCYLMEYKLRPEPDIGWNTIIGGKSTGSTGRKASEETRKKMSLAQSGRKMSEEAKAKMSKAKKGVPLSESHKKQLSISCKGRKMPEGFGARKSEAMRGRPSSMTEEGRKSLSEHKKSLKDWERGKANKEVWAIADQMFSYFLANKDHGHVRLAKAFLIASHKVRTVLERFRTGWNPNEDAAWLEFKTKYLQEALCQNTAF